MLVGIVKRNWRQVIPFFIASNCVLASEKPECLNNLNALQNTRKMVVTSPQSTGVEKKQCGAFISWRLSKSDTTQTRFNLYQIDKKGEWAKINGTSPLSSTNFSVQLAGVKGRDCSNIQWVVETLEGGKTRSCSKSSSGLTNIDSNWFAFPYSRGAFGRSVSIGSLISGSDNYMVVRLPDVTVDPYYRLWRNIDEKFELHAVDIHGKQLWAYDMGPAIEPGIWYSPYLVYDLDGNGVSELIVKTGEDNVKRQDIEDSSGRVTRGKEFLTIIDGRDGNTVLARAAWPDRSGFSGHIAKPHESYNRYSRNMMAIAYLDGIHPHVVVVRGTYGKHKVQAFRYQRKTGLSLVWQWENTPPSKASNARNGKTNARLKALWGQGAHTIRTGDLDADGKDEVIIGSIALDDNGEPLWSMDRGHVDHIHLGDLIPSLPGLEMYFGSERAHSGGGMGMVRAETGEFLWRYPGKTRHIHKEGVCANFYSSSPGLECYSGEADQRAFWLWDNSGKVLSRNKLDSLSPLAAYWGDTEKHWYLRPAGKNNSGNFLEIFDLESGALVDNIRLPKNIPEKDRNSSTVLAIADIFGDWREEIVVAARGKLLVYTSNHPSEKRKPWLMNDHIYAMGAVLSSMGYYQQPILGESPTLNKKSLADH